MRAEEIIAEIYRQKRELLDKGIKPDKVVFSMDIYRILKRYRELLGVIEGPVPDYLQQETVFGLTVCIDSDTDIKVYGGE